jgi:hypothetical protein
MQQLINNGTSASGTCAPGREMQALNGLLSINRILSKKYISHYSHP